MTINFVFLLLIFIVAAVDVWLVITHRKTISQWYQARFVTTVDIVIMVTLLCIVCLLPIRFELKVLLGAVAGHVFWPNKEGHI
jgi:hypothetical protein